MAVPPSKVSTGVDAEAAREAPRPTVSVLVPFVGGRRDGEQMAAALATLRLGPGDQGIVADNSPDRGLAGVELPPGWSAVSARREGSPAHTRNVAAMRAACEWLLFVDSDVQPPADLLYRFFAEPIPDDVGVVGGRLLSDERQRSLAARWADSRGMTAQERHVGHPFRPYFLSACMLTRRKTWSELGGFHEGIFNGEDVDFCWRAVEAGWRLRLSSEAAVVHLHRETVKGLTKQAAVRGASATWVYRRWPQAPRPKRPGARLIAKGIVVTPVLLLMGQRERAQLRALDVATQLAERWGTLRHNRARARPPVPVSGLSPVELWCEEFPLRSDDSVAVEARELTRLGHPVLVVGARRPDRPALGLHDIRVHYLEDETSLERLWALARVAAIRPLACLRDLRERRGEGGRRARRPLRLLAPSVRRLLEHPAAEVRVHAGSDAAAAMRVSRLAGRPCRAEPSQKT